MLGRYVHVPGGHSSPWATPPREAHGRSGPTTLDVLGYDGDRMLSCTSSSPSRPTHSTRPQNHAEPTAPRAAST